MNKYYFEGKTQEQAINLALYELNISEDDLIVNNVEDKSSLLKKNVKIEVLNIKEIISFIKDTLNKITELMGAKSILIGKNGKNVAALQLLIRQMVNSKLKEPLSIIIDVGNYKEKRARSIEYLAKKLAREAYKTKTEVTMDSMNSYERRIVHEVLANDKYVYTESIGEEPNRKVVIKLKESK